MAVTTRTILQELTEEGGAGNGSWKLELEPDRFPVYFSCWGNFFLRPRCCCCFLYVLRSNNVIS